MKKALLIILSFVLSLFSIFIWGYTQTKKTWDGPPLRFAVIGDRTGTAQPGVYEQITKEIERLKPDFAITVGDMIEGPASDTIEIKSRWEEYKKIIATLSMPIYFTPGNNDIWDSTSLKFYQRYVGNPYHSFDVRNVHFIVLDNSLWDTIDDFPKEQISWVTNDLEKNRDANYTMEFYHKPFWIETIADGKPDTLHTLFARYGVDATFNGHYHEYFSGEFDGIKYTGLGSSGGACSPGPTGLQYHFLWVTVDGGGISIAPIKLGGVLPWDELTAKEYKLVNRIKNEAISFEKVPVSADLTIPETKLKVTIKNINEQLTLKDTLKWEIPTGWSVTPSTLPLEIAPLQDFIAEFLVKSSGSLYPTPTFNLQYPYAEKKKLEMENALMVSRMASAYKATKSPIIDGKLTEDIWKEPTTVLFAPNGLPMSIEPVNFYFAWDKDNLYLAAKCTETKMDQIVANAKKHDDAVVFGDDCVGYFLQPVTEDGPVYQIYFNPLGTPFDQKITVQKGIATDADIKWNGNYTVKSVNGEDYWSVEAKIPMSQFKAKNYTGKAWSVNFRRKQKRLNSAADWLVPTSYDPKNYGVLIMK